MIFDLLKLSKLLLKMRKFLGFFFVSYLFGQNLQKDIDRYLPFSVEEVEELAQDLTFDPRGVVDTLTSRLSQFYLSDPSQKKIEQRQLLQGDENLYVREWNVNIQRLFIRDLLSQEQKGFIIKEAPNIALMHLTLARAYIRQRKPYHAAYHYAMTLRYRSLRFGEEVYTNEDRLRLLPQNLPEVSQGKNYQQIKTELAQAKKDENRIQILLYSLKDNLNKNGFASGDKLAVLENQIKETEQLLESQKTKIQDLEQKFQAAQKDFEQVALRYNRESSQILVEMAELVRQIEDSLKERQKILNKKVLYKTEFNQTLIHDYSLNRQFTAYANLLEAASRLDDKNPQIPYRLGKEYATSQEVRRAIYAYEKALRAQEEASLELKLENRQLYEIYVALGSLYFQTNQVVESAYYYELALKNAPDEASVENLTFQLGKFHIERTGNYTRGIELLNSYRAKLEKLNPTDKSSRISWLKERFLVSRLLAQAYEKKDKQKSAQELQEAILAHNELEKIIEDQQKLMKDIFRQMQQAKKPLLSETRQAEYNEFRRLEDQYELTKKELSDMLILRNSLPISSVYFQYAYFLESENDINGALNVLKKAELLGLEADRARRLAQEWRKKYMVKEEGT